MTPNQQCVVAVYETLAQAKQGLKALDQAGFSPQQVSLVASNVEEELKQQGAPEEPLQYGDKTEKDASMGAGMGGVLGLLAGASLLAIPGIGPIFLAGPIAAGLTGAIVGGILGAMTGWGVHEDHVAQYQELVKAGHVLVVVQGDPQEVAHAQGTLKETEASDVDLHAKATDESPEVDDRME